ncbi:uncharacterized protein IUM83_18609 [Phytophthora cinnamomi]|uniref:uncharacterized protein n=1 Tax=Phytophthora cinnamomi TaxID=4785 RepID=UPI0035594355|nr:hypothetical protein IUM83_18609 [Phytophthora cinnamomi]
MGSTWSSNSFFSFYSSSPSTLQLQSKDVLALCEDGDLLLAREKLADSALRVGVEFVVARDIQRMQRGQFPSQRVTSLPPWTSCELLLRHEGALRVIAVNANGLELVPFEERVASKMPHIHDRFAIRRLQYDARSENLSSALRELALQIASVAPISWHSLLFPSAGMASTPRSPRSPRQQSVDREAVVDALKVLPPLVRQLLWRTFELLCLGLKDIPTTSQPADSKASEPQHPSIQPNDEPTVSKAENQAAAALRVALEAVGIAEFTARLSAAFVVAVYEYVHLVNPINSTRSEPLVPAAFWSGSNDNVRLTVNPSTALGLEMALTRPS